MNNAIRLQPLPFDVILSSIAFAFFIDTKCISMALVYGGFVHTEEGGVMVPLYFIAAISVSFCYIKKLIYGNSIRLSSVGIFLSMYLICYYFFSSVFVGKPGTSLNMFLIMTILAFVTPQILVINTRVFLKTTILLPCFAVLRMNEVFASTVEWDMRLNMHVTYGFLIPVVASIVYTIFYLKEEIGIRKLITYSALFCNFLFFLRMLQYGSRGPLLCIVLLIIFLYISSCNGCGVIIGSGRFQVVLMWVAIVLFGGYALLSVFSGILEDANIHIRSVEKILTLGAENNLSNGRDAITEITLTYIGDKPIFGYGLDRFDEITNGLLYPHNFILQLLFDGGLLLFTVIMVPICKNLNRLWRVCNKEQYILVSTLVFASVPGALFSDNLWHIVALWIAFGAIIKCNIYNNKII